MTIPRTSSRYVVAVTTLAAVLSVGGCKSATAPKTDDATLSAAVQSRLTGDSALTTEPIQSKVENGVVTLNGTVSNDAARALAASDVAQVSGIKTVVNNLTVSAPVASIPPPEPTPAPVEAPKVKKLAPKPVAAPKPKPAPIERHQIAEQAPAPAPPPPAPVAAPAPPPPPAFRTVTVPSGTTIPVRITQALDSATAQLGQTFSGTVATDIMADGLVAIHQGSSVSGRVSAVQEAAHYKGNSLLTVELVSINRRNGEPLNVSTQPYSVEGKGRGKNTAAKVGGGAAIGAIIGAIAGGGKGAAIGSAAGAGVGAGANTVTRGEQVKIPSESLVNFQITNTLTVRASTSNTGTGSGRRPMNLPDNNEQPQQPQ